MKAGKRIEYEDDVVIVTNKNKVMYKGIEDYEPMKDANWKFVVTTKSGKGHYECGQYRKYCVG